MSTGSFRAPDRVFRDRHDAGEALVPALRRLARERPVVVAIPRGGVAVACEVAHGLHAPIDVALVHGVATPAAPKLRIAAVGEGGVVVLDREAVRILGVGRNEIESVLAHGRHVLASRQPQYRAICPELDLAGRTVVLVDDGIATGVTAVAAARVVRAKAAARVVLAVPVSPANVRDELRDELDELVWLERPDPFYGIAAWYEHFPQISDAEVTQLLARTHARSERPSRPLRELVGLRARLAGRFGRVRRDRTSEVFQAHRAAQLRRRAASMDQLTARVKSSRHGKSTADKWNQ